MGSVLHSRAPWCGGGADGSCLPRARLTCARRCDPNPGFDHGGADLRQPVRDTEPQFVRRRPISIGFVADVDIGNTVSDLDDPSAAIAESGPDLGYSDSHGPHPQPVRQSDSEPINAIGSHPEPIGDSAPAAAQ